MSSQRLQVSPPASKEVPEFVTHGCDEAAKMLRLPLLGLIGKLTDDRIWRARQGMPCLSACRYNFEAREAPWSCVQVQKGSLSG